MIEKKNKAVITYTDDFGDTRTQTIGYNTLFSFCETPDSYIFMVNESPIKVLNKKYFISLELVYHTDPDDLVPGDGDNNVVRMHQH